MAMNKIMVFTGIVTMIQSFGQIILVGVGLAQYFCFVDFLKEVPLLLYIRILYLHNPSTCGQRINIGESLDGVPNQAFVLVSQEPVTVFRTFIVNSIYLSLNVVWLILGIVVLRGGVINNSSKHIRWPWVTVAVLISTLDVVSTATFANDSFHTRTMSELINLIDGTASGLGGVELNTAWASWTMVLLTSRFVFGFVLNVILVILIIVDCSRAKKLDDTEILVKVESPTPESVRDDLASEPADRDVEEASSIADAHPRIPRPGLSQSFRRMKTALFTKLSQGSHRFSSRSSATSQEKSSKPQHADTEKKRTVNFPENLLSLPQRLENLIAEQQRRLDNAVIDTAGRSPPRTTQSLPQLDTTATSNQTIFPASRRGTAAELQGQLPWAYVPASTYIMRDQLPSDEERPPVPLPDYTAIQPHRKASVHRAASSLSSLTQRREQLLRGNVPPLTQADVLY